MAMLRRGLSGEPVRILQQKLGGEADGIFGSGTEAALKEYQGANGLSVDGIVCSPLDLAGVRAALGPDFLTVVPGIRPAETAANDQKRIATPASAIAAGADILVIGRAITGAADPAAAARAILASLA